MVYPELSVYVLYGNGIYNNFGMLFNNFSCCNGSSLLL